MDENQVSYEIIAAAIETHRTIGGPGLLGCVYEEALSWEPEERGMITERQKLVPIVYKGNALAMPLRMDLLVNNTVIVECKAVSEYNPIYETPTLTYLRLTGLKLSLVINFGTATVKRGIKRVVHNL